MEGQCTFDKSDQLQSSPIPPHQVSGDTGSADQVTYCDNNRAHDLSLLTQKTANQKADFLQFLPDSLIIAAILSASGSEKSRIRFP
jgi:hypothetical protein